MDRQQNPRTRVIKACDRCRGKKAKCNGGNACSRCKNQNAICTYSRETKERQPSTSPSYVLTLETHVKLLARGIQGMYQLIQHGESLPGGPLQIDEAGNPLLHDILDRLGVLEGAQQHNTFQWNPAIVNRLVYSWETSQPNLLPLRTSAPEDSPNVWRSDQLSNHFTYNDTYDLDATILNTVFDTTLNAVVDPAVDTVFNPTLSTDMHVEQEIKQNDWIMGLH